MALDVKPRRDPRAAMNCMFGELLSSCSFYLAVIWCKASPKDSCAVATEMRACVERSVHPLCGWDTDFSEISLNSLLYDAELERNVGQQIDDFRRPLSCAQWALL